MGNDAMVDLPAVPICVDLWPRPAGQPTISNFVKLFAKGVLPDEFQPEALFQRRYLWTTGATVRVAFLDGDLSLRGRIADAAQEWTRHANLALQFVDVVGDSDIRVSFRDHQSSWSRIGTDCRSVARSLPTMNLGVLTTDTSDEELRQLVLHEFGHALGLLHEHQHPALGIAWNRPAVYNFYARRPYYWDRDDVDRNIFDHYSRDVTVHSEPDIRSIMMYPINPALTTDGFGVELNRTLSETDKEFIAMRYPPD